MSGLKVEISWDSAHEIASNYLKDMTESLTMDYYKRKAGEGYAIFDIDPDADLKLLKEHIKAFETVLKYCGEN